MILDAFGAVRELERVVRLLRAQLRRGYRADDGDLRVPPQAWLEQPRELRVSIGYIPLLALCRKETRAEGGGGVYS